MPDYKAKLTSQQAQNICITFVQCWSSVKDVGPTLYKCYTNVLCLLGLTYRLHTDGFKQHPIIQAGFFLYKLLDVFRLIRFFCLNMFHSCSQLSSYNPSPWKLKKWISIDVFGHNYIINDVCICKLLQQCILYILDVDAVGLVGVMIMGERGYFCNADDERHIALLFFVEYWPRGWGDLVFVVSLDLCPAAGQHNVSPYSLPDSPGIPNMSHKHIPEPLTSAATRRRHRGGPPPGIILAYGRWWPMGCVGSKENRRPQK